MTNVSFNEFYKDLKETEEEDSDLTSAQQIERLLRPGATYRNLNPYDVLQLPISLEPLAIEEVRKKYKRLSILVHPDKNIGNSSRAQLAFDAVKKAYGLLENEGTRKRCIEVVEEAIGRTARSMEEKRKLSKNAPIPEDDPSIYKNTIRNLTAKLFADSEVKRQSLQNKVSEGARKKRENELEAEAKREYEKEFAKNWEESRQERVQSWHNFTSGGKNAEENKDESSTTSSNSNNSNNKNKKKKKDKRFTPLGFRPPKTKPETR